jgi:hypothetical protein
MGFLWSNNASSLLVGSLTAGATSLTVTSGDGVLFPDPSGPDFFQFTIIRKSDLAFEICRCTARASDVFSTILRAQEGTTALAFADGDLVEHRPTAAAMADLATVADLQGAASIYAADVGTADAIAATYTPTPTLGSGLRLMVNVANTNTGPTTFNPNGLGATNIVKYGVSNLEGGDVIAGQTIVLEYESSGPEWQLISSAALGTSSKLNSGAADDETPTGLIIKNTQRQWTKQQNPARAVLSIVPTEQVDWDTDDGQVAELLLDDDVSTLNITNAVNGTIYTLIFKQDAVGEHEITWPGTVKWPFSVVPLFTTGPNDENIASFYYDGTDFYGIGLVDFGVPA